MSVVAIDRTPRYLGAAIVFQFATSLAAGLLSAPLLDGGVSDVLRRLASNPDRMRTTVVLELLTSIGILAMSALLYLVLSRQDRTFALVALVLWTCEAVFLTVKTVGLAVLLSLSQGPGAADAATASGGQSSGALALSLIQHAGDVDMLFFCVGAMPWYWLLYRSRIVPRVLALWGLLAVPLVLVATLALVWNRDLEPSRVLYAPYVPFELVLGLWLLGRGAHVSGAHGQREDASTPDLAPSVT
ncbi:DUF4386 domain-containing protein [Pedococcus sp. NPDC057267]|uniref:DUF4386 domain-containing protein n=1 Tax=Pedococcus sp. NPDC057267 TaxID=3346077 RepID=UPI0036442FD5